MVEAVRSGWVSSIGPFVDRFERELGRFVGTRSAVVTSNGTAALHLALLACGVGEGDEVILPSLTFVATANAVRYCRATPVVVDVDEETWCLSPAGVARALSARTRAIIAVHLYGHPADMDAVAEVTQGLHVSIIEDAAEALGARYRGRPVGTLGAAACLSFYGNKIITTGEGGAVVSDDDSIERRVRFLKDHGMDPLRRYYHPEVAYNYRMTNLQAALGCAQLSRGPRRAGRSAVESACPLGGSGTVDGVPGAGSLSSC